MGGRGKGRVMPDSGLALDMQGEESGPEGAELSFELDWDRGEVPDDVDLELSMSRRTRFDCGVLCCRYENDGAGGG